MIISLLNVFYAPLRPGRRRLLVVAVAVPLIVRGTVRLGLYGVLIVLPSIVRPLVVYHWPSQVKLAAHGHEDVRVRASPRLGGQVVAVLGIRVLEDVDVLGVEEGVVL